MAKEIIIDAEGVAIGRFATFAAKQALLGNKVVIINCNEAVITGKQHAIMDVYKAKKAKGGFSQKGPYISRVPDRIVKRTVRGMLPWEKATGRIAFKLVTCYPDVSAYAEKERITFKKAKPPYITLKRLSVLI